MSVHLNIIFAILEISRMLKIVIKCFKISKLFYHDKRIITLSIFLIDIYNFLKNSIELVKSNIYAN